MSTEQSPEFFGDRPRCLWASRMKRPPLSLGDVVVSGPDVVMLRTGTWLAQHHRSTTRAPRRVTCQRRRQKTHTQTQTHTNTQHTTTHKTHTTHTNQPTNQNNQTTKQPKALSQSGVYRIQIEPKWLREILVCALTCRLRVSRRVRLMIGCASFASRALEIRTAAEHPFCLNCGPLVPGSAQHRFWACPAYRETRMDLLPTHQHQGQT